MRSKSTLPNKTPRHNKSLSSKFRIFKIFSRTEPPRTVVVRPPKDRPNDDYDSEDEDYTEKNLTELK